jgi:hypothetical protein
MSDKGAIEGVTREGYHGKKKRKERNMSRSLGVVKPVWPWALCYTCRHKMFPIVKESA